jgi:predicted DNA-binding transcriptional regulator YafY
LALYPFYLAPMKSTQLTQLSSTAAAVRVYWGALLRLKRIRAELRPGRYPSRAQIAAAIESKVRTVQRDLDFLRDQLKAPIEYNREQRGYYLTDPNWRLPEVPLTEGELISFFVADHLLRQLSTADPQVQMARNAVKRLATLLPSEVVINPEALSSAISFAPAPALAAAPDTLRQLTEAAAQRETLRVTYFSQNSNKQGERLLNVLGLHQQLGEWYAVAAELTDGGKIKDFHAGRISTLTRTGRRFTPPADWEARKAEYLNSGFGMFRGGAPVTVVIEFDADQARYIRERTYHDLQQRDELTDGRLRLSFPVTEAALPQVARWVMQYGAQALVVEPVALKEMVRERLEKALTMYETQNFLI